MKYPSRVKEDAARKSPRPYARVVDLRARMSEKAIEERDRRFRSRRNMTGSLMGDPRPGYSALEKQCRR
jgi:hypothetical protein